VAFFSFEMSDTSSAAELDDYIESNTQLARELSAERRIRCRGLETGTPPLSWPESYVDTNTQIARELNSIDQVCERYFA
jgi:hypothetical protein